MERQNGYYWVRINYSKSDWNNWEVTEWLDGSWLIPGDDYPREAYEVNENQIKRKQK